MPEPTRPDFVSYADFGYRFFESAVTQRRVERATAALAGRTIEFGPTGVGPIGLVRVRADGAVGTPSVARRDDPEHVAFTVTVPIDLRLIIEIGIDRNRFTAQVLVTLALTARAARPLVVVIDIAEPTPQDVAVDLQADGVRASVLKVVAGVEREVRRTVAKVVRSELCSDTVTQACVIDVGRALEAMDGT